MGGRTSVVLPYKFSKFFLGVCVERYPQEGFAHSRNAPVVINCNDAVHGPTGFEVAHHNGLPVGVVSVLYLCSCLKLHEYIKPYSAAKVEKFFQKNLVFFRRKSLTNCRAARLEVKKKMLTAAEKMLISCLDCSRFSVTFMRHS